MNSKGSNCEMVQHCKKDLIKNSKIFEFPEGDSRNE